MSTAKKILYELIEEMPDKDIIDYLQFLKLKREKELYSNLPNCSEGLLSRNYCFE